MIKVCSGWHPAGGAAYGRTFLTTFNQRWPESVGLEVYVEEPEKMPRHACRSLWDIPGAKEFAQFVAGKAEYAGRVAKPCWKASEVRRGYSFRTDAAKFWKQLFIPQQASADMADGDVLIWLDGDVMTTKEVPLSFIEPLTSNSDITYLGREPSHSEIGFWSVRLSPKTRGFLAAVVDCYLHGDVFNLPEWHSAYVWDHVRKQHGLDCRNLCRPGSRGHVFPSTVIGRYLDHRKGPRKGTVK